MCHLMDWAAEVAIENSNGRVAAGRIWIRDAGKDDGHVFTARAEFKNTFCIVLIVRGDNGRKFRNGVSLVLGRRLV